MCPNVFTGSAAGYTLCININPHGFQELFPACDARSLSFTTKPTVFTPPRPPLRALGLWAALLLLLLGTSLPALLLLGTSLPALLLLLLLGTSLPALLLLGTSLPALLGRRAALWAERPCAPATAGLVWGWWDREGSGGRDG
eukprot:COSAG02_NODE_2068_length_9943_cov_5.977245_2_plen_142_part_00